MKPSVLLAGFTQIALILSCCVLLDAIRVCADQVEMRNGDRYFGKVVSANSNHIVFESDALGTLRLVRSQVASVGFNPSSGAPVTNTVSLFRTNDLGKVLVDLKQSTNSIKDVQESLLSGASPEATQKFNEMVSALLTGRMTVADVRVQAESAAKQLRELKKDLGDEAGPLDGYLEILENFLKETPKSEKPAPAVRATKPAAGAKPAVPASSSPNSSP